jgi:hypothetical protein
MAKRPLFHAGSFAPYTPPSIATSVLMILAGILIGYFPFCVYLDYRDHRDNTASVQASITNISTKMSKGASRSPHLQATVTYVFTTPDGRRWTGTMVRPAIRAEHLKVGAPVAAMYKPDDPARNTTQDELDYILRWTLMPAAGGLALWFTVNLFFILQAVEIGLLAAEAERNRQTRRQSAASSTVVNLP